MKTIKLELDYLIGPIIKDVFSISQKNVITGIDVIDNDEIVRKLDLSISTIFSSCYEFDKEDITCFLDEEKVKKEKQNLMQLLTELKERLDVINDGTFVIEDLASKYLEKL